MCLSNLIDSPGAFSDSITALEIEVLDNIEDTDSHPDPFVSWLLYDLDIDVVIQFGNFLFNQRNRISSLQLYNEYLLPRIDGRSLDCH